jgi:hypothetical protein
MENRVLRRMFGPKRKWQEAGEDYNEELHNLYTSNIIKVVKESGMRWTGYVAHMGQMKNTYKIMVRKPEGKRPLGKPRCRWEDNIRMDLREIEWNC